MLDEASLILPGLWVGTYNACALAQQQGMTTLCVADPKSAGLDPEHGKTCRHLPIMVDGKARINRLNAAGEWIFEHWLRRKQTILVHCMIGQERSPLTVVWFMHRVFPTTFDAAYAWVQKQRPVVQDRRAWLEPPPPP